MDASLKPWNQNRRTLQACLFSLGESAILASRDKLQFVISGKRLHAHDYFISNGSVQSTLEIIEDNYDDFITGFPLFSRLWQNSILQTLATLAKPRRMATPIPNQ